MPRAWCYDAYVCFRCRLNFFYRRFANTTCANHGVFVPPTRDDRGGVMWAASRAYRRWQPNLTTSFFAKCRCLYNYHNFQRKMFAVRVAGRMFTRESGGRGPRCAARRQASRCLRRNSYRLQVFGLRGMRDKRHGSNSNCSGAQADASELSSRVFSWYIFSFYHTKGACYGSDGEGNDFGCLACFRSRMNDNYQGGSNRNSAPNS